MSNLTIDQQYDLSAKIQSLIMLVGILSDDEIEALKELKESLEIQISSIEAVTGLVISMEDSEKKVSHINAMIKRIDALVNLNQSNIDMKEADERYAKQMAQKEKINNIFGLNV